MTTSQAGPPKAELVPTCTEASSEPRDKYSCGSEAFFSPTTAQDFPGGSKETHQVGKVQGGMAC